MAQDLYYISSSLSLILINDNGQTNYWNNITSLDISGSGYDAPISGSEFIGTVGTARIYAYSGSVVLVSFPLENTNIYYNYIPNVNGQYISSSFVLLDYSSSSDNSSITGSYFSIYDLTTSRSYINSNETGSGGFTLTAGNNYLFSITESNGNTAYLYFKNITSGSNILTLSASSNATSSLYVPVAFNDYQITFSVIVPAP
jgi:hypothetical protein